MQPVPRVQKISQCQPCVFCSVGFIHSSSIDHQGKTVRFSTKIQHPMKDDDASYCKRALSSGTSEHRCHSSYESTKHTTYLVGHCRSRVVQYLNKSCGMCRLGLQLASVRVMTISSKLVTHTQETGTPCFHCVLYAAGRNVSAWLPVPPAGIIFVGSSASKFLCCCLNCQSVYMSQRCKQISLLLFYLFLVIYVFVIA